MALTLEEEKRFQLLENAVANHAKTFNNVASKKQLNHVLALLTKEINTLKADVASLKAQLQALSTK